MRQSLPSDDKQPISLEFILIMAALVGVTALSIDIMLPALPQIASFYGLEDPNARQLVVISYIVGFAVGQLPFGPLSDSYGRKPVLLFGLGIYVLGSIGVVMAQDFTFLLIARAVQGLGGGAPRVITLAIVRDLYQGRKMARVMSFVMAIFVIVPVLAPTLGEGLILAGHWNWTFWCLVFVGGALLVIAWLRVDETHPKEARKSFSLSSLPHSIKQVVTTRVTLGYTIVSGLIFGSLMAYINTAEQIFGGVYQLGVLFPIVFGAIALAVAVASLTNGRLVEYMGMRCLSVRALLGFITASVLNLGCALAWDGEPPLFLYCSFLVASIFCFGFIMANVNALALDPLKSVIGTASSFIGFCSTAAGAFFGWLIGQEFAGTVTPLLAGHVLLTLAALGAVLATERQGLLDLMRQKPQ